MFDRHKVLGHILRSTCMDSQHMLLNTWKTAYQFSPYSPGEKVLCMPLENYRHKASRLDLLGNTDYAQILSVIEYFPAYSIVFSRLFPY